VFPPFLFSLCGLLSPGLVTFPTSLWMPLPLPLFFLPSVQLSRHCQCTRFVHPQDPIHDDSLSVYLRHIYPPFPSFPSTSADTLLSGSDLRTISSRCRPPYPFLGGRTHDWMISNFSPSDFTTHPPYGGAFEFVFLLPQNLPDAALVLHGGRSFSLPRSFFPGEFITLVPHSIGSRQTPPTPNDQTNRVPFS